MVAHFYNPSAQRWRQKSKVILSKELKVSSGSVTLCQKRNKGGGPQIPKPRGLPALFHEKGDPEVWELPMKDCDRQRQLLRGRTETFTRQCTGSDPLL